MPWIMGGSPQKGGDKMRKILMDHKVLVLVAALFIALAAWGEGFESWKQLLEVRNVFALIGSIGSVVLAWLGKSPVKEDGNA